MRGRTARPPPHPYPASSAGRYHGNMANSPSVVIQSSYAATTQMSAAAISAGAPTPSTATRVVIDRSNSQQIPGRPLGAGCFLRCQPKLTKSAACTVSVGKRLGWRPPFRFCDAAANSVHNAHFTAFEMANSWPTGGWAWPDLDDFFDCLRENMYTYPIYRGGSFFGRMTAAGCELDLGIVREPRFLNGGNLEQLIFVYEDSANPIVGCPVIMDLRGWKINRRKFNLPGRNWVTGPYLAVLMVDRITREVIKCRLWPVYFDPLSLRFGIVRSEPERAGVAVIDAMGAVGFTPTHHAHLEAIQNRFGGRFRGDISQWRFLPDEIIFPVMGGLIHLMELYAVRDIDYYTEGKKRKHEQSTAAMKAGSFGYIAIDLGRKKPACVTTAVDQLLRPAILNNPVIWR